MRTSPHPVSNSSTFRIISIPSTPRGAVPNRAVAGHTAPKADPWPRKQNKQRQILCCLYLVHRLHHIIPPCLKSTLLRQSARPISAYDFWVKVGSWLWQTTLGAEVESPAMDPGSMIASKGEVLRYCQMSFISFRRAIC